MLAALFKWSRSNTVYVRNALDNVCIMHFSHSYRTPMGDFLVLNRSSLRASSSPAVRDMAQRRPAFGRVTDSPSAVTSSSHTAAPAPSGAARSSRAASGGAFLVNPEAAERRFGSFHYASEADRQDELAALLAQSRHRRIADGLWMATFFASAIAAAVMIGFGFAEGILRLPVIGG